MIYLALFAVVAGWLTFRWMRLQSSNANMAALIAGMSRSEAQAEYNAVRAQLSVWIAAGSSTPVVAASHGALGAEAHLAPERKQIEALAERGAWMMDRIRALDGVQTGPAQRIRAKMDLLDAAAQGAHSTGKRD